MFSVLMKRSAHQNQLQLSNKIHVFKRSKEVKGIILGSLVCLHLLQNFRETFKLETFSIGWKYTLKDPKRFPQRFWQLKMLKKL